MRVMRIGWPLQEARGNQQGRFQVAPVAGKSGSPCCLNQGFSYWVCNGGDSLAEPEACGGAECGRDT